MKKFLVILLIAIISCAEVNVVEEEEADLEVIPIIPAIKIALKVRSALKALGLWDPLVQKLKSGLLSAARSVCSKVASASDCNALFGKINSGEVSLKAFKKVLPEGVRRYIKKVKKHIKNRNLTIHHHRNSTLHHKKNTTVHHRRNTTTLHNLRNRTTVRPHLNLTNFFNHLKNKTVVRPHLNWTNIFNRNKNKTVARPQKNKTVRPHLNWTNILKHRRNKTIVRPHKNKTFTRPHLNWTNIFNRNKTVVHHKNRPIVNLHKNKTVIKPHRNTTFVRPIKNHTVFKPHRPIKLNTTVPFIKPRPVIRIPKRPLKPSHLK